jgi:isoquinoline 1-oxidoreductase beta subunit
VPAAEITTSNGFLEHKGSGKKAGYGELASLAATLPVPEEVALKDPKDFTLIGTSKKNVDLEKIIKFQDIGQACILVDEETIFGNVCLYKFF